MNDFPPSFRTGTGNGPAHVLAALAWEAFDFLAVAKGPDFRVVQLSERGRRLLGISPNETGVGLALTGFLPAAVLTSLWHDLRDAAVTSPVRDVATTILDRSGVEHPLRLAAALAPKSEGEVDSLIIAGTAFTPVVGGQDELARLQQDQALLRALLDRIPDSLYFKDRESRFIYVSRHMAKNIGGRRPDELVGQTDSDYFSPELTRKARADEELIMDTGQPLVGIEEKETWADGHVTWVSTWKMPLFDAAGRIIGTFGMSRDITARRLAEEKLRAAQKELVAASRLAGMAEIASGVLHNIGNALNSVNTSVALVDEQLGRSRLANLSKAIGLLEEHATDVVAFLTRDERGRLLPTYLTQAAAALEKEQEEMRGEISQLRHSLAHIMQVVAMQQDYAGGSAVAEDAVPAEVVEEALQISALSLDRHGVQVRREYVAVPRVHVVRHKVLQILVNLIRNAKYATDESGRPDKQMTITLEADHAAVRIGVRDNGVGIAPENLTRIFSFGFTTRPEGRGFGLHSSANAAKELGGTLRAFSAGPGRGACFVLEVPVASGALTGS